MAIIYDCKEEGCGECDVCQYLSFIEHAESCAVPGSVISRDPQMEAYLKETYPTN